MASNASEKSDIELIERHIKSYPDFPKKGIVFQDVLEVLEKPKVFATLCKVLVGHVKQIKPSVDYVVALDARGFLLGPIIALQLGLPFAAIRKKNKLPGETISVAYELEYGKDEIEIQKDKVVKGKRYLIVDDLLATGGTLAAACQLIQQGGAAVAECLVVIELTALRGREKFSAPVHSLVKIPN